MSASAGRPVDPTGWVDHLRAGGTTEWSTWAANARPGPAAHVPGGGHAPLPGAQQLELLRRLNVASEGQLPKSLPDRVFAASAAGRGKPELGLLGAPSTTWGHAPVDPSTLSAGELLRVAVTVLAEDVVAMGADRPASRMPRPWRTRYRMVGNPLALTSLRASLVARGLHPGGQPELRTLRVLVLAGPFDRLLSDTWTRLAFESGAPTWPEWLAYWAGRDEVPPRLDLARLASEWTPRPRQVRVLTDPDAHARVVPSLIGTRPLPQPHRPGADAAELARRTGSVLRGRVGEQRTAELMTSFARRVPDTGAAPVAVPPRHRAWVERIAGRVTLDLRRAGYSVVGDLADLAPRFDAVGPTRPDGRVLDLAMRLVADDTWQREPRSEQA